MRHAPDRRERQRVQLALAWIVVVVLQHQRARRVHEHRPHPRRVFGREARIQRHRERPIGCLRARSGTRRGAQSTRPVRSPRGRERRPPTTPRSPAPTTTRPTARGCGCRRRSRRAAAAPGPRCDGARAWPGTTRAARHGAPCRASPPARRGAAGASSAAFAVFVFDVEVVDVELEVVDREQATTTITGRLGYSAQVLALVLVRARLELEADLQDVLDVEGRALHADHDWLARASCRPCRCRRARAS